MIECPVGENFCWTDLEVDWMMNGDQYTTVTRSCQAQLETLRKIKNNLNCAIFL